MQKVMAKIIEQEKSFVKIVYLSGPHKDHTVLLNKNQTISKKLTTQSLEVGSMVRLILTEKEEHGLMFNSVFFDEDI